MKFLHSCTTMRITNSLGLSMEHTDLIMRSKLYKLLAKLNVCMLHDVTPTSQANYLCTPSLVYIMNGLTSRIGNPPAILWRNMSGLLFFPHIKLLSGATTSDAENAIRKCVFSNYFNLFKAFLFYFKLSLYPFQYHEYVCIYRPSLQCGTNPYTNVEQPITFMLYFTFRLGVTSNYSSQLRWLLQYVIFLLYLYFILLLQCQKVHIENKIYVYVIHPKYVFIRSISVVSEIRY